MNLLMIGGKIMADFSNLVDPYDGVPWGTDNKATIEDFNAICSPLEVIGYRSLAIEIAVDLISNSFASVVWNEYKQGKQVKNNVYNLLNIAPNKTEVSQDFMKRVARRLLLDKEALIIPTNNNESLFLADTDFTRRFIKFDTLKYSNVKINTFDAPLRVYTSENVIYLTLHNDKLIKFLNAYQSDYDKVLKSATNSYQTNKLKKYYISSDAYRSQLSEVQQAYNDKATKNMNAFLTSTNSTQVFAKPKGYEISQLQDNQLETASDVRNLITDVFNMTANAFHIPPEMMFGGSVNQMIIDNYLVNAVMPLVEVFTNGFNVWNYTAKELNKDSYVKADTSAMRLTDLNTVGNFIQKVFPTGALTLGDVITKYLHLDKPEDEINDLRVITKNYGTVEQFINGDFASEPATEEIEYDGEKPDATNNEDMGENQNGN